MRGFPQRQVSIQTLGFFVGKQADKNPDEKIENRSSIFLVEIPGSFPDEKPYTHTVFSAESSSSSFLSEKNVRVYEAFRFPDKKTAQNLDEKNREHVLYFLVMRFFGSFPAEKPKCLYTYLPPWKPAHARNDFDACAVASKA